MKPTNTLEIKPGDKYGKLTVISETDMDVRADGYKLRAFICRCDCGVVKKIRLVRLRHNKNATCGCAWGQHGDYGTNLHNIWRAMRNRGTNPNYKDAHRYFNRGIRLYEPWNKYQPFKEWALLNGYKEGLEIDRRDNNKGYFPDNCRFVPYEINVNNREVTIMVDYKGERVSLALLLRRLNIREKRRIILQRLSRGWTTERAIEQPAQTGNFKGWLINGVSTKESNKRA